MNAKIPVGDTIANAYSLAFKRYPALLRIVWLPGLLLIAAFGFIILPSFQDLTQAVRHQAQNQTVLDPAPMPDIAMFLLAELILLACYVWMGVGVAREALGMRKGSRFYYLPGMDEVRVTGAFIIVFMIAYLVMLGLMLVGLLLGCMLVLASGGSISNFDLSAWQGPAALPFVAIMIAIEIAAVYVMVRLTYLVVPVTLVERRIAVLRSWRLMRGNVLRAVAVWLVTLAPLCALEMVFGIALMAPVLSRLTAMPSPPSFADLIQIWRFYLPFYLVGLLAVMPIIAGLMAGPSAFAYRALVPKPKEESARK
jgi:hypothetical protein